MKNTKKLTFAAISCGLSVALLYIGSLIQTGTLAIEYAVGLILMLSVSQNGAFYGILTYAVTSVLTFYLLPDKSLAISYFVFFGSIPIVKYFAEKCPRISEWIIKVIFINIFICILYFIFRKILVAYPLPVIYPWIIALITGVVYDLSLSFGFSFAQRYFKKNP